MIFFKYKWLACVFLLACPCEKVLAQWNDDFSGDLSAWSGDVGLFVINEEGQLQLNAPDAGSANLWRSSTIDADTISIGFYHLLDFAPSDNNKSIIYLGVDNTELSMATGYYMEIGENGSNDAIKFYYLDTGVSQLIATGTMGAVASEPAQVRIQIDIYPSGLWSVGANYTGGPFTSLDLEFMDDRFDFSESAFFGLFCQYSASRSDKFFYDDVFVRPFERDVAPPIVTEVNILDQNTIDLSFNEPVEETSALDASNYTVSDGVGNPSSIQGLDALGTSYRLIFEKDFTSDILYSLDIKNISDVNGNTIVDYTFLFNFAGLPSLGDLLLSEILFDPYPDGDDFVEIYNTSDKFLNLQGLTIRNDQRDDEDIITEAIVINPQSYIALGKSIDFLLQEYKPDADANIADATIPAFNNDEGNVMLIHQDGTVLDSFDYDEDMHFSLLDDTEGVSLERVAFDIESTQRTNWRSAAQSARYATPGYANSAAVNVSNNSELFDVLTETFSPNQDGNDDVMIMSYNLEKAGFIANIYVHDAAGFRIATLANNQLLSTQGIITWDGLDGDGKIADLGIYIIIGELFHSDGDIIAVKETTVLADFID